MALDAAQPGAKADEWTARLSGGQRSRVAPARAPVSRPRLMARDEPLVALDALTRIVMQDLILDVRREVGFTAVLVTHDVADAASLSGRVIVLDGGRIAHDVPGPVPDLVRIEAGILEAILGKGRR